MNKVVLGLVCLDIVANFLLRQDYVICLFKCTGLYGVITGDLCSIVGYVLISCVIALHGFSIYIFFCNIFSFMTCFVLLKNTCDNEVIQTELGFK
jgi:hypothetical protein